MFYRGTLQLPVLTRYFMYILGYNKCIPTLDRICTKSIEH